MRLAAHWHLVTAVFLLAVGCRGGGSSLGEPDHVHDHDEGHDHDHGHPHEHGPDAVGITVWTDKLELYAEHSPAVAGETLEFVAHLTVLDGFAALEKGAVVLELDGPMHVSARADQPSRPGIFKPALKAPGAGTYRGRLRVTGSEVTDVIEGFDIVVQPNAAAAAKVAEALPSKESASAGKPIPFLKEQQWQVPFATKFAVRGTVVPTVEVSGEVTTPPSGQADVGAAIAGRVVAPPGGLPRPGQTVRRGALLATIAPAPAAPEAGARAELAVVEAEARLQSARAGAERAERLIQDRAISNRELEEATRELRVATEALQAARSARDVFTGAANGKGGGLYRMTTPIDGVVVDVTATEGKSVQGGEVLFRVVNLGELWIRAHVPEQDAAQLRATEDAAYALPGVETWLPLGVSGDDAVASVVSVGRTVDRRSRTVDVIYALRTPDERLRVGALVRVAVPVGPAWEGVVVPRSAVLSDDGRAIVYVQTDGESFEERAVTVGPRSGEHVGILRGVVADERVVSAGSNVIRLSSRTSTALGHGHVH